jgi:hypothetical protein
VCREDRWNHGGHERARADVLASRAGLLRRPHQGLRELIPPDTGDVPAGEARPPREEPERIWRAWGRSESRPRQLRRRAASATRSADPEAVLLRETLLHFALAQKLGRQTTRLSAVLRAGGPFQRRKQRPYGLLKRLQIAI